MKNASKRVCQQMMLLIMTAGMSFALIPSTYAAKSVVHPNGTVFGGSDDKVWIVHPEITDGMTGAQQLTNAVRRAPSNSLILVEPGEYDLSDVAMRVDVLSSGGSTYVITNHLSASSADRGGKGDLWFALVADVDGENKDQVVFKGKGRCLDAKFASISMIRGITFDGFDAGSHPSGAKESFGGALRLEPTPGYNQFVTNCIFRNCKAQSGGAIFGGCMSGCVVSNCHAHANGGACMSVRMENSLFVANSSDQNCGAGYEGARCVGNVFIGNRARGDFGACSFEMSTLKVPVSGCRFIGNVACGSGGALGCYDGVEDCIFTDNIASNGNAGALYLKSGKVSRSSFTGNMAYSISKASHCGGGVYCPSVTLPVTDCGFTNNFAWGGGGAVNYGACTNCSFVGNRTVYFGAALKGVYSENNTCNEPYYAEAYNCVFRDNSRRDPTGRETGFHNEYGGCDGFGALIVNCDSNVGGYWRCAVVNTRIHEASPSASGGIFYEQNFVTNCLIDNCRLLENSGICYRYMYAPDNQSIWCRGRDRASFVNCTFASNLLHATARFISSSSKRYQPIDFLDCILYENRLPDGTLADISGHNATNGVTYSKCMYGAADGSLVDDKGNPAWEDKGDNIVCGNPRFVADKSEQLKAPYWSLRTSSPARGKGCASIFSEEDVDLAGNPRLRGGRLDLGCYQCWLDPVGAILLLK